MEIITTFGTLRLDPYVVVFLYVTALHPHLLPLMLEAFRDWVRK